MPTCYIPIRYLKPTIHTATRIHMRDGRIIDVPYNQTLPSQDGNYWIFVSDAPNPPIYCFFAPMEF